MSGGRIAIGSRGSALALAQAGLVGDAFERDGRPTRLVVIETDGDRRAPDTAWGEGAFVAAIEEALLDGRIDVAVHSAKDVPIGQDDRLRIAAYLPRADPRDALVVPAGSNARSLADLPPGTKVGTDSPRRTGFLRAHRPDLVVHPLHGNVDTRLRRLDAGETDALVLACAGLDRLGLGERIAERLAPRTVLPAPGQGAIAIQIRADDGRMLGLAAAIDDPRTRLAVEAERAFLETSGGGCRAPTGALATFVDGNVHLIAGHAAPNGSRVAIGERTGPPAGARSMAVALAIELMPGWPRPEPEAMATSSAPAGAVRPWRQRVLVTRAAGQTATLARALEAVDLEPVLVPSIEVAIEPLSDELLRAADSLRLHRWVIVTSANGARAIVRAAARVRANLDGPSWATVGAATADVLERDGLTVAFRPTRSDAAGLARELPVEEGDRVLIVRGDLARGTLADELRARGAVVEDVVGYHTKLGPATSRPLLRQAWDDGPPDAVVFSSGSTVAGLLYLAEADGLDVRGLPVICIGPETERAARDAGFRVRAVAATRDAAAIAAATVSVLTPQPMEIA